VCVDWRGGGGLCWEGRRVVVQVGWVGGVLVKVGAAHH
jgi:hypothetical protein